MGRLLSIRTEARGVLSQSAPPKSRAAVDASHESVGPEELPDDRAELVPSSVLKQQKVSKVGASVGLGAVVISSTIAVAIVMAVLTGVAQDFARRKSYKSGGELWNWLCAIPSLRHPYPYGYRIGHYRAGVFRGSTDCKELYKRICLMPYVSVGGSYQSLDDWGGFFKFTVNIGQSEELVVWYDDHTGDFGTVTYTGEKKTYRFADLLTASKMIRDLENL